MLLPWFYDLIFINRFSANLSPIPLFCLSGRKGFVVYGFWFVVLGAQLPLFYSTVYYGKN
jgi:hypothetical protein